MIFGELIKDVPEGNWILISEDQTNVLDHGPILQVLIDRNDSEYIITKKYSGTFIGNVQYATDEQFDKKIKHADLFRCFSS